MAAAVLAPGLASGTNTLYKYKDTIRANIVLVKNGVLAKAVCKGAHIAVDLNGTMSPVTVVRRHRGVRR